MKNEANVISVRYYIFSHDTAKPNEDTVRYRESTGGWCADFDKAMLWSNYDFVVKKAKELKRQIRCWGNFKTTEVVIGKVNIEVDGFYPMVVV